MDSNTNSFTYRLVRDVGKILALKISLQIEHATRTGHTDWAIKYIPFLTGIVKGFIRQEDAVTSQIKSVLSDTINENLGKIDDNVMKRIKEEVAKFNAAYHMISELDKIINGYRPAVKIRNSLTIYRKLILSSKRSQTKNCTAGEKLTIIPSQMSSRG